jgi:hypothetical protein
MVTFRWMEASWSKRCLRTVRAWLLGAALADILLVILAVPPGR